MLTNLKFHENETYFKGSIVGKYDFSNDGLKVSFWNDMKYGRPVTPFLDTQNELTLCEHSGIKGVYVSDNIRPIIQNFSNFELVERNINENSHAAEILAQEKRFGVADNIQQILKERNWLFGKTARLYILAVHLVRRDDPKYYDWQWSKNGEYIGKQKICHKFLRDEQDITEVMPFEFIEIRLRREEAHVH